MVPSHCGLIGQEARDSEAGHRCLPERSLLEGSLRGASQAAARRARRVTQGGRADREEAPGDSGPNVPSGPWGSPEHGISPPP